MERRHSRLNHRHPNGSGANTASSEQVPDSIPLTLPDSVQFWGSMTLPQRVRRPLLSGFTLGPGYVRGVGPTQTHSPRHVAVNTTKATTSGALNWEGMVEGAALVSPR